MRSKTIIITFVAVIVLAVGYYLISPLFITKHVDEALPVEKTGQEEASNTLEKDGQPQEMAPEMKMDEQMPNAVVATEPAEVQGTTAHPADGTARIVEANSKKYLRYENFKTINGPDIYVYLSKDVDATDFVDLGAVKGTEGNINYEIPGEVDPREYPYALTWCKQFKVLFNSAKLY